MYILYFIRIICKSAKVLLFQLILKGLRFVKGLADVLQIDFLGVFLQISFIILQSLAGLISFRGLGIVRGNASGLLGFP